MKKITSVMMVVICTSVFSQVSIASLETEVNTRLIKNNLTTTSGETTSVLPSTSVATLIPFLQKGKYGYKSQSGKVVIKPIYNNVCFFADDCRILNSPNEKIREFGSSQFASVQINGVDYRIDDKGQLVYKLKESELGICPSSYQHQKYLVYKFKNSYGLIEYDHYTEDGNKQIFKIPPQYEMIHVMESEDRENPMLIATKNDKFGIIDINNNIIVPFEYMDIKRNFSWKLGHLFEVSKDGKHFYYIDSSNKAYK